MELFKLVGTIALDGEAEVSKGLSNIANKTTSIAKQVADKLDLKVKLDADKAESALKDLSQTIAAQENVLEALKRDYAAVTLEHGKNSKSARSLAKQIKTVSKDLNENKTKLQNAEDAADKFDKTLHNVDNSAKNVSGGGFTVLKGALANLVSQGFSKLISVGTDLAKGAIDYQMSMEGYQTSFQVMTGSAQKAAEVTERLGEIASSTPFELTDLADTTQLLMNYGFTADDAMSRMQMLGDISQGSADKMNRIAMAYGQMSSAGKVSLEDVKQMIEAGFNPLQEISQTTGESMASLYDRISDGKLSIDEITDSMKRSTSEGGKYFGSMNLQSQTLEGRLSTLKDTVNSSLGTALQGALTILADEVLPKVTAAFEKVDWEAVGEKVAELANKIIDIGTWVIDNWEAVSAGLVAIGAAVLTWKIVSAFNEWKKTTEGVTIAQKLLNTVMNANPIGIIITAVMALVAAFIYLWNTSDEFRAFWINLWEKIKSVAQTVWEAIKGFFVNAWEVIKSVWSSVAGFFSNIWSGIKSVFSNVGSWFREKFNAAKQGIQNAWSSIKNFFANIKQGIVNAFSNVKEKLSAPFEKARDAIKKVVDKIKGFFSKLKFKWPKLKMPKFSVSPAGWKIADLIKGVIPKLDIAWNADGAVFDEPTIFATPRGFQGVGEAGAEAVAPIDVLTGYVQTAVQRETNGMRDQLEYLTEMLASFFPQILAANNKQLVLDTGVLVGEIAPKMNLKLNDIRTRNARGG